MINISYHSCSQAILDGPELNIIREHFSVKNEAAHFQRRMGRYVPARTYVITNQGRVDIGLIYEVYKFCLNKNIVCNIDDDVTKILKPSLLTNNNLLLISSMFWIDELSNEFFSDKID